MRQPIARKLWWLGLLGLLHLVDESLSWTGYFFLLFFAPLLTDVFRFLRKVAQPEQEGKEVPERQLPGPAERGGPLLFFLRCSLSEALILLNPRGCRELLRQLRGEALAHERIRRLEPTPDAYEQKVEYALPFVGEWTVARGGITPETSHSWEILSQRYAYDFVVVDPSERTHRGDGSHLEDYYAYGEPILAPADGEVTQVIDGVRDGPHVGTGWTDWRAPRLGGNSVTIRHAEGEFSYLAHLIPGSIPVRVGQRVLRGEEVGRCGHSGNSTEPHLHFQIQDHADCYQAVGLPVKFSTVLVTGSTDPHVVHLQGGMRVRQFQPGPSSEGDAHLQRIPGGAMERGRRG